MQDVPTGKTNVALPSIRLQHRSAIKSMFCRIFLRGHGRAVDGYGAHGVGLRATRAVHSSERATSAPTARLSASEISRMPLKRNSDRCSHTLPDKKSAPRLSPGTLQVVVCRIPPRNERTPTLRHAGVLAGAGRLAGRRRPAASISPRCNLRNISKDILLHRLWLYAFSGLQASDVE